MLHTRICDLFGIANPIVLGGMGGGHTAAPLVAAVSNAGGLGVLGVTGFSAANVQEQIEAVRAATDKPFGVNFLLFLTEEAGLTAAFQSRAPVMSFAWPHHDQDLRPYVQRAHDNGALVMHMVSDVPEAVRAAEAHVDVIVAQGTEGGGHVGWIASMPLVPMVVQAVAPVPVIAAGGIADGRGLAAALALGADGVLLGTRFLATTESPLHPNFKQAIVNSDGHDTILSEIPDVVSRTVWPGAMSRTLRNRFIEQWAGREWDLRRQARSTFAALQAARVAGEAESVPLFVGQDAGLIDSVLPAGEVIRRMVEEAEQIITQRLPSISRTR
jgi:NAD(P)H-dependent flavin oxidoreductase YrpB (nitropropane dioxygenase family)